MVKNLPTNAWGAGSIPGLGRSPGAENGNPVTKEPLDESERGEWKSWLKVALGWPREMVWGGRWEGGSGLGTLVHRGGFMLRYGKTNTIL